MSRIGSTLRARARRAKRRRRAQLLPHQALHLVGPRLVHLDRREHADDRLHRRGHRGDRRRPRRHRVATSLLIGAVVWAYLGVLFEFLMETVAWERWEGTIEYTFMAPLSRPMHLGGHGHLLRPLRAPSARSSCSSVVASSSSTWRCPTRSTWLPRPCSRLLSISFLGIGMMTSVLPLISPEKGTQLGVDRPRARCSSSRASTTRSKCCRPGWSGSRRSRRRRTRSTASRDAILDGQGACRRCGTRSGRC